MRLVILIRSAAKEWEPYGITCALEESTQSNPPHVHAHVYFHFKKRFQNRSLDAFIFEGIHPHLEANRALGKAYDGAVRRGHYYSYERHALNVFGREGLQGFKAGVSEL